MWALIQSFAGYYGLVNLASVPRSSVSSAATSRWPTNRACVRRSPQPLGSSRSRALVLTAAVVLAEPAAVFFEISTEKGQAFTHVVILCAIAVVTDFYGALFTTLLTSKERFDLSNGLGMAARCFKPWASWWPSRSRRRFMPWRR